MSRSIKILFLTAVIGFTSLAVLPSDAQAGPLLDWLRSKCRRPQTNAFAQTQSGCNTCATPQTAFAPTTAQYTGAHNPAGLQPGQCMRTCNQTCSRTVVNYVPQTEYRTSWKRVPCTQYKPVTNSDPCTGCTVTCMKPCTTYSWKMERQPYTTYRPVYRQENYTVPVTTISNDCATGTCGTGTCATGTCGTPAVPQQPIIITPNQPALQTPTPASVAPALSQTSNYAPYQSYQNYTQPSYTQPSYSQSQSYSVPTTSTVAPYGTISTGGSYQYGQQPNDGGSGTRTSAPMLDSIPVGLNPQNNQRPVIDRFPSSNPWPQGGQSTQNSNWNQASNSRTDSTLDLNLVPVVRERSAKSPVRQQWSYSPVRLASHTEPVEMEADQNEIRPDMIPVRKAQPRQSSRAMNSGWEAVQW